MLPPRTRLDPQGYYARLGVDPTAPQAAIVAAFRGKARLLHPDVARTGNADAFVAMKQAYDVLSNRERREDYDRRAREAMRDPGQAAMGEPAPRSWSVSARQEAEPEVVPHPAMFRAQAAVREAVFNGPPVAVWVALGAFLCLCVYQLVVHLLAPPPVMTAAIRPNAAMVEPLSPSAHRSILYGPNPVRLAGTPNFYVLPAGTPTVLWRLDNERNALVPLGKLPPFSMVQAVRMVRQTGMLEVRVNDGGTGFISADHLTPGDAEAARQAYCGYNSGPAPMDGELLQRRGFGSGKLTVENQAVQPAVVKLRDQAGAVMLAVYLGPGGKAEFDGLPEGLYRPEFAIGELWSRACNMFAAGMRARRLDADLLLPGGAPVVVARDGVEPAASDISDQAFQRD